MKYPSLRWLAALVAAGALAAGCGNENVIPDQGGLPDTPAADHVTPPPDSPGPDVHTPDGPGPDAPPDGLTSDGPGPDGPPRPLSVGGPCTLDSDCGGAMAFCITEASQPGLPGGYCSASCAVDADCGSGAGCVDSGSGFLCIATCAQDSDCRDGYICQPDFSGLSVPDHMVCAPGSPGTAGAVPGDPCTQNSDCPRAGICITEADGSVPGGYCITSCNLASASANSGCPAGSTCVAGSSGDFCVATCTDSTGCRASAGYACAVDFLGLDSGGATVCAPGQPTAVTAGTACTSHGDCTAGRGFCLLGFPGGYCTTVCNPAAATSECGADEACADTANGSGLCTAVCTADTDCRGGNGYICEPKLANQFEVPGDTKICSPGTPGTPGAAIGDPCSADVNCMRGGTCLTMTTQMVPDGYCTLFCTPGGDATAQCGATNPCFVPDPTNNPTAGLCLDGCTATSDCRMAEGYTCAAVDSAGDQACVPPQTM
jgi:hypothetical protein